MDKIELTLDKVIGLAQEVVADYGSDYEYHANHNMSPVFTGHSMDDVHGSACRYEFAGESCCLVGKVLERAGFTVEDLRQMDRMVETMYTLIDINPIALDRIDMDPEGWQFLRDLQDGQDSGDPWGEALENAIGGVRRLG